MELPENKLTDFIKSSEKAKWIPVNNHNAKNFTEDDITRITNNYSTPIGQGGFGQVYRGSLDDGTMVAVKKYIRQNVKDGFAKEMIVHCQINHKNVVRLLGYCSEDNALMIVTEYVSRGNLKDLLFGSDAPISLDARLRIAIECADALGYMHSSMYQPMIHGDIKPDNILLDHKLGAKLSDFGLSRLLSMDETQYTMHVAGSRGYMDPEYLETGLLDPKSDVYSFGVVLLELVTRAKASKNGFCTDLKRKFINALGKGKQEAHKMFDTNIVNERDIEILDKIGNLAAQCFTKDINERPEMKEVLGSLQMLRKSHCCEQDQEKRDQNSSSGSQAIIQKVDPHDSSIPSSSSISTATYKFNILDIFNRKSRGYRSNGDLLQENCDKNVFTLKELERINNHGSSIPRSSSDSTVTYKFSILDIFNKKSRMLESYGGSVLKEAVGIKIFTLKELKRITCSYSNCISEDHTGFVYKGCIETKDVAVKRSVCGDKTFDTEHFVKAMLFADQVRHANIISLVGCCLEREPPLLVYEFVHNKSLHDLLHCYNGILSLDLRLSIAMESAEALQYLHSHRKLHGNITSKCIMLDCDLQPKVDIFCGRLISNGLCLECFNMVYIDPVYINNGRFTSKSDIYSFGIVLLELITRKQPIYNNLSLPIEYIKACKKAMFDEEIAVDGNILILEEMGKVAVECLRYDDDMRPEIGEVVERLRKLKKRLEACRRGASGHDSLSC